MIATIADQYLSQNAGRRYPLADDVDVSSMPDNVLLDFRCTVRGVTAGTRAYAVLASVDAVATGRTVTATVWQDNAEDDTRLATLVFQIPSSMAVSKPYTATASDGTAYGELTVSSAALTVGTGNKGIRFSPTTVYVDTLKVDSITADGCTTEIRDPVTDMLLIDPETVDPDDPASGDPFDVESELSGDIVLDNGYNAEPYLDGKNIRLDIFKGAGVGEKCQTVSASQACDNVLFSINGERPGSDGELRILGKNGVIVTPKPKDHAIEITLDSEAANRLSDTCKSTC